jgi:hypothetical protein
MNFGILLGLIGVAGLSSLVTYLLVRVRAERQAAEQGRALAETLSVAAQRERALAEAEAALAAEKSKFELAAKGLEETVRRQALDEFLADLHVEERHYVREHRILFAHRKSLVLQERIFFRNMPISNWVEHEIPVEEGADLDSVAKTLSVFNNALEAGEPVSRASRWLTFRAG